MALSRAQLLSEITNDPKGMGYAAMINARSDEMIAQALNAKTGPGIGQVFRPQVGHAEVLNCIDRTEWNALTTAQRADLNGILAIPITDFSNANVRAAFTNVFGAASATRAALLALVQPSGSRAEVLGGYGTVVTSTDVAQALGRGL